MILHVHHGLWLVCDHIPVPDVIQQGAINDSAYYEMKGCMCALILTFARRGLQFMWIKLRHTMRR